MLYTTPNQQSRILAASQEDMDTGDKGSDRVLLISVILLMIFGILAVYSSIAFFAESNSTTASSLVFGHMVKLGIAFIVMLIASKFPYDKMARFSKFALIISWLLLIIVQFQGTETFGARRALDFGGFSFQPSSMAAVALLFYLSQLLTRKAEYIKDFKRAFLPMMFWILPTCTLIGLEDFSTAGLLMATSLLLMFIGRAHTGHLAIMVGIGLMLGAALIYQSPERQNRIKQYVDQIVEIKSEKFALGEGYQTQQAHIAIARGNMLGVGVGKSTQRDFLPAPYNDFIFAIIAEEYGLVVSIAKKAPDDLGLLMGVSATLFLTLYGFINAAVACGLLPVTGLPMPFVSYGGTSMLFAGLMVGVLLNISKHKRIKSASKQYRMA